MNNTPIITNILVFALHTRCFYMFQPLRLLQKKLLTRTLNLDMFVNFSMLLKVLRNFFMCLFFRLVRAKDFDWQD